MSAVTYEDIHREQWAPADEAWFDKAADQACAGSGQPWRAGTGQPRCGVCWRGPRGMGVPTPARKRGTQGWVGVVPAHEDGRIR